MKTAMMVEDFGKYEPSIHTGFLEFAPRSFSDSYYKPWDSLAAQLPVLLKEKRLRNQVDVLPVLSIDRLRSPAEWRRAHSLLSFVLQGYIWQDEDHPWEEIPAAVAVPFSQLCEKLGVTFAQSYADLVLWNWTTKDVSGSLELDDLTTHFSFTGTKDEEWFHLVSIAIEAKGAKIIQQLLHVLQAVREGNSGAAANDLLKCVVSFNELRGIMGRIRENCRPEVFYHRLSPFLAGSNTLENGLRYKDVNGMVNVQCAGGSNAMTSLIALCDIVLGIEHEPEVKDFLQSMHEYMPAPHRQFLQRISQESDIPSRMRTLNDQRFHSAYEQCILALRDLRATHIQIATQYLIIPGRRSAQQSEIHGNASQSFMPLLQRVRDCTR